MIPVFDFLEGNTPLLVSIPHDGRELAPGMRERMTATGAELPDTDWYVRRLYEFAPRLGASVISANYSRYVVDLNRPATDYALYEGQLFTGVCPVKTFDGANLYLAGEPISEAEKQSRIAEYWRPYHNKIELELTRIRDEFGYALLWDAHSIPSEVPALFTGTLAVLNIGTVDGKSCENRITEEVSATANASRLSFVVNGRFKGGYITRAYGNPEQNVHALQLEKAQRAYMDEQSRTFDEDLASRFASNIEQMVFSFLRAGQSLNYTTIPS